MRQIKKGSTDQSVIIRIVDSGDGTPETGVEHNTSGIDLFYRREGAAVVSITEAALTALTDAHSDGGIEHIGGGYYRLDLPDAAVASGANGVLVGGTITNMVVIGCYIHLVDYDPQDSAALGLTMMPSNVTQISGDSAAADNLESYCDGTTPIPANATQLSGDATAADNAEAFFDGTGYAGTNNVIPLVTVVTTATNLTNLPTIPANWLTTAGIADGAITDAKVANDLTVGSVTGSVGSVTGNVGGNVLGSVASVTGNVGGNVVGSVASVTGNVGGSVNSVVTGVTLAASAVQAIWDALTSSLSTVGSIGKLLVDRIDAAISSRSSHSAADVNTLVWANGTRTLTAFSFSVTVGTNSDKTGYTLATDGIPAAALSTAAAEKQADITLRRRMSNVEASSFGDALHLSSFYGFVQMGQEASVSGGTMTVNQTDGTTALGTKTLTSDAAAEPITGVS